MTATASSVNSDAAWQVIALQLEKDGSLAATYSDPASDAWTFGKPVELAGGTQTTPKFTAIATNFGRRFFGLADGGALEYKIEDTLPKFTYTASILAGVNL